MYLPFDKSASKPQFKDTVHDHSNIPDGLVLFYTNQCPFTAKYVPIMEQFAKNRGVDMKVIHIDSKEMAQSAPSPFTTFNLYYNKEFLTHEILSDKKFQKVLESKGL